MRIIAMREIRVRLTVTSPERAYSFISCSYLLIWPLQPNGRRGDLALGRVTSVPGPGSADGHQHPHLHVLLAQDLAREAYLPDDVPHPEDHHLGLGHLLWLAFDELHAAGGAPRVGAAGVHDVHACVLLDGQNQPLALLDVEGPHALHFQLGHPLPLCERSQGVTPGGLSRSEEHTSELQSRQYLVCRLLLEKKKT